MAGPSAFAFALALVLYVVGARLGVFLSLQSEGIAVLWPPNAVLLSAFVRFDGRGWARFSALALLGELVADASTFTVTESIGFWITNVIEATVAWRLLRGLRFDPDFAQVADVARFVLAGPLFAALFAAFLGAQIYSHYHGTDTSYLEFVRVWWMGDGLGLLIFTPLLLDLWGGGRRSAPEPGGWRITDVLVATGGIGTLAVVLAFRSQGFLGMQLHASILLPFMLYGAARCSVRAVCAIVAGVSVALVAGLTRGAERLDPALARALAVEAQEFILVLSVMSLGLAALLGQLRAVQRSVVELNAELETRIAARTAELKQANGELEAFSYSVSHDLRAPLRAVDGFARLMEEDYAARLDDEGRRMLGVIRAQALRMGRLIDDLLTFSRVTRQAVDQQPIEMQAQAREVFDALAALEPERTLRLELGALPPARGAPALIRQVWENLLANAIKFTRDREVAVIEVGAHPDEGGGTTYYVKDNGAGFDMRYADKLFGVFQRLHSDTEFPGTGIGLSIVARIVHRHGGRVWAEAEVDRGATFSFTLGEPTS
jgi:signal transduction histidine kinase